MNVLVLGGAASGKSAFAEQWCATRAKKQHAPLVYVATLNPDSGGDTAERIQKHRTARADKGFATVEWCDTDSVPDLAAHCNGAQNVRPVALLEDGGNLVANYLYPPKLISEQGSAVAPRAAHAPAAADAIIAKLHALSVQCADLLVVSNEISLGGEIPEDMRWYADVLAAVNAKWAAACEVVYAVVAGIPIVLKGESVL